MRAKKSCSELRMRSEKSHYFHNSNFYSRTKLF